MIFWGKVCFLSWHIWYIFPLKNICTWSLLQLLGKSDWPSCFLTRCDKADKVWDTFWLFYDERIHCRKSRTTFFLRGGWLGYYSKFAYNCKELFCQEAGKVVCAKGINIVSCSVAVELLWVPWFLYALSIINRMFHTSMDYDFFWKLVDSIVVNTVLFKSIELLIAVFLVILHFPNE